MPSHCRWRSLTQCTWFGSTWAFLQLERFPPTECNFLDSSFPLHPKMSHKVDKWLSPKSPNRQIMVDWGFKPRSPKSLSEALTTLHQLPYLSLFSYLNLVPNLIQTAIWFKQQWCLTANIQKHCSKTHRILKNPIIVHKAKNNKTTSILLVFRNLSLNVLWFGSEELSFAWNNLRHMWNLAIRHSSRKVFNLCVEYCIAPFKLIHSTKFVGKDDFKLLLQAYLWFF